MTDFKTERILLSEPSPCDMFRYIQKRIVFTNKDLTQLNSKYQLCLDKGFKNCNLIKDNIIELEKDQKRNSSMLKEFKEKCELFQSLEQ